MASERNRLTRIYTRSGDQGTTRLVGGQEVSKASARIRAYGTVDELSSALGLARALRAQDPLSADGGAELERQLRRIQNDLFHVGADLATEPADRWENMVLPGEEEVRRLEGWIDAMNEELGPLKEFLLPGGGLVASQLHVARTLCRRAEREVVPLVETQAHDTRSMVYLNRLSDYLFVAARHANRLAGHQDELWER